MVDIIDLLEYNRYLRHQYLETLGTLPWEAVIEDRAASFNSMRNIFLHCIGVVDWIVNHIIQGDPTFIDRYRINYDDYDNFEKILNYLEEVESKTKAHLSQLTPERLSRTFDRNRRDGSTLTATTENHLVHLFQEETHHRGELIALLWQKDVRPPHAGWLQYLTRRSS